MRIAMANSNARPVRLGWIGLGRMGYPMAERLLKAGHQVAVWNRTRAKAEPLAAYGAQVVDRPSDLAGCDVVLSMVSTGKDLKAVCFGEGGLAEGLAEGKRPAVFVDCSSISVEESAEVRSRFSQLGVDFVAAPVSGNGKCVKAGKLSSARRSGPTSRPTRPWAWPMSAKANSPGCARSPTTSCWRW
jgi:3-hydroxyisobutyrate dehydrogenase